MAKGINKMLADEFGLGPELVSNIVGLIDGGNSIPFIARYRKEMTGCMDDQALAGLYERLGRLRSLAKRKEEIRASLKEQGITDPALEDAVESASTISEAEDLYRPYKPKRKTRASAAREKGLEPLAELLVRQEGYEGRIDDLALQYLDPGTGVDTVDEALRGAMDIIAEEVSDDAAARKDIRQRMLEEGVVNARVKTGEDTAYDAYRDFRQKTCEIPGHRILALMRGEKEGALDLEIEADEEGDIYRIGTRMLKEPPAAATPYVAHAVRDAYKRLMHPSISGEVKKILFENAAEKALKVFAENLKQLLLQPPLKDSVVLGVDPAYRTGCKLAVVDATGDPLYTGVIYPTPPQCRIDESKEHIIKLIRDHEIDAVSIGNGTASRETEIFIADTLKSMDRKVGYMVVSEAGASVYSVSKTAAVEFPDLEPAFRSAVSIARRLQDPLAELVKIDPGSIGVGQYQHDMDRKKLGDALSLVVETCVDSVGVDLNTASLQLLSYISGIGPKLAEEIVRYREKNGKFTARKDLLKIKRFGEKTYEQCAGFLRIPGGDNILDNTAVHPESYAVAENLLHLAGHSLDDVKYGRLDGLEKNFEKGTLDVVADIVGAGIPTVIDILRELSRPGRDPRGELPGAEPPRGILSVSDLKAGMIMEGTVRNITDFGAFIDIGVHQDGLVHISQMSEKYVKYPMDIVKIGQRIKVKVLETDSVRGRISLTMKF